MLISLFYDYFSKLFLIFITDMDNFFYFICFIRANITIGDLWRSAEIYG